MPGRRTFRPRYGLLSTAQLGGKRAFATANKLRAGVYKATIDFLELKAA